jgi:hypothetical protein
MNTVSFIAGALLLALAALTLARTLPAQNIAFIVAILIASELALETIWNRSFAWTSAWCFWPAIIILARVWGRWILRCLRKDWNYGIWLIFLVGIVTALLQFATTWAGANWSLAIKLCALRFAATAFCLFWLSPWFISKFPQQPQERAQENA